MKKSDQSFYSGLFLLTIAILVTSSSAYATGAPAPSPDTIRAVDIPAMPPMPGAPSAVPPPVITSVTPALPTATAPPLPSSSGLTPIPSEAQGEVKGTNVMGDTGPTEKYSGQYYDSDAIVPNSALDAAGVTGPRKVDPATEPGQKYIVVETSAAETSYEAQYVAATRALKLARYAAAMEMFEKLHRKNARDPRILMGLAVAQQGAGFNESAAQTYEDLLTVEPNNANAIVNLMGLTKDQYPSVTMNRLNGLRNKYPNNPGIPAQMGLISAGMKHYDDAIRNLEIAASMDPKNPSHIYNMAIVMDRAGNVPDAIKLYQRALELDSTYGDAATALPREEVYDRLAVLRSKVQS